MLKKTRPPRKEVRPSKPGALVFPPWVTPPSPCWERTNSVLVKGPHGMVRHLRVTAVIP